ncbi:MAG: NAD(+) synthase [Lachnospiraceae bacterium]|nr:NAD(+) synthase [Lachnospiraceae bacterium]
MKDKFLKVCAATPTIRVADCEHNADQIIRIVEKCYAQKIRLVVFPELCLTGYTCGDLFLQQPLLDGAKKQLRRIAEETQDTNVLFLVGAPLMVQGKLYNTAVVFHEGEILGIIPKKNIPAYSEFYEARHFNPGNDETIYYNGLAQDEEYEDIPFGTKLVFQCEELPEFIMAAEICEDLWVVNPPSSNHAVAGATVICNLSASDENTGKDMYRKELVKSHSARLIAAYIYADAGEGESTTDLVFSAHNLIAENGQILAEAQRFENEMAVTEIDLERLISERRRITTFQCGDPEAAEYENVLFSWKLNKCKLTRKFDATPFVPSGKDERDKRCFEIFSIQSMGLKKRLEHTNAKTAVIGISGGLDSTLALLVTARAFDLAGKERKDIIAVTMPCFGTTDRTYQNAIALSKQIGATLLEIPIRKAVSVHFTDINHDLTNHDVTYENGQARERTQVLMDLANEYRGMVIGTGDLSELALGWATYNGDHMSMYGVNASVPKTLVRYLVSYYMENAESAQLRDILADVLDTPVSPELLPPEDGEISQKTEDLVGPYELHDFFLYYVMRFGYHPKKIFRLAQEAFGKKYDKDTIHKWLRTFYYRFFSQQFKRSCLPDGPKVGSVTLSPRGDFRMPSDACATLWLQELEEM